MISRNVKLTLLVAASTLAFCSNAYAKSAQYDWSGPYVGLEVGNRHVGMDGLAYTIDPTSSIGGQRGSSAASQGYDGVVGNVHAGYNWQTQYNFVFGVEASANFADTNYDFSGTSVQGISFKHYNQDFNVAFKGRFGYSLGKILLFGSGGGTWEHFRTTNTQGPCGDGGTPPSFSKSNCSTGPYNAVPYGKMDVSSDDNIGWTAGGGVELGITKHVSARVEYVHSDYGTYKFAYPSFNRGTDLALRTNDVMVGVNYKF